MLQLVLMWVCLAGAALGVWLSAVLWLHAHGIRPLDEVIGRFRRLPRLAQVALLLFVVNMIVYGSTKTNQVDGTSSPTNAPTAGDGGTVAGGDDGFGGGSVTNGPGTGDGPVTNAPPLMGLARPMPGGGEGVADGPPDGDQAGFAEGELAEGYAVWRVGTNETWSFDAPPGADFAGKWLLRGAAEDWAEFPCGSSFTGPARMDTFGRIVWSNRVFTAFDRQLAVVPRANWRLLGTNAPSRAWHAVTPWGTAVFTWQNALLGRETNVPVSVQAEFTPEGHYVYRYDLSRAGTNLTSVLRYRIQPEDLENDDRDGDGIPNWEEVTRYHCDPGLVDSDGDGLLDGEEVANGTDPSVRSVPNADIVARITGSPTNEAYRSCTVVEDGALVSMKLWDGFAADWSSDDDIVFERTLDLGDQSGWQHYFLTSAADGAGGWDLRGLVLEWDDGCGSTGAVHASPAGDSLYLPLTNCSSLVTIRLRAIGPKVRAPKPMWLLGYAPTVDFGNGRLVESGDGSRAALVVNARDGAAINLTFDRSGRPCHAPLYPAEALLPGLADIDVETEGKLRYEGDGESGTLVVTRPGEYEFPSTGVEEVSNPSWMFANNWGGGLWIVAIDPSIRWGGSHLFSDLGCGYDWDDDRYSVESNYPLNSRCLWESWQRDGTGGHGECDCVPEVRSGTEGSGAGLAETDYSVDYGTMVATGYVTVFGEEVWSGTCEHTYWGSGGGHGGSRLLSELEECEECEDSCTGGKCNYGEGPSLGSVKFRLPLGTPRRGQASGWIYFGSDVPLDITPSAFQWMKRDDASITHSQSGSTRTWRCFDNRGRDVVLEAIPGGVRLTVSDHATSQLDHTWEITNVEGSAGRIRMLRRNKRNLRMVDETYAFADGDWSRTDNVTGLREVLHRVDDVNGSGVLTETRTKYDADGNQLDRTVSVTSRIGRFGNAVLRETRFEQDTGFNARWREATYWDDPGHAGRHGQLRLLTGNSTAWEYHDWNDSGFEILRVEQRNGSAVPASFPSLADGEPTGFGGLADATVTVFDYTPVGDDDCAFEDNGRVRCETRYVVRNGNAVRVARTWFVYTRVWANWYPAVKVETYRAAGPDSAWNDAGNAYSYVVTFDGDADGVPLVMRGMTAEELDESGVLTCHDAWEGWESVYDDEWTEFGDRVSPTVRETVKDALYGNVLSVRTYVGDDWTLIDEETSDYDDQNRLLRTTYRDGTSVENQYSCCRLLQSRDREGRLTVRSAVTGEDKAYYAEEKVYLNEMQTNGFGVTQHFMDALGRETRTVTYLGTAQGEAADWTVSQGRELTEATTAYPYGGDDYSVAVDERGRKTVSILREYADRTETEECVYPTVNGAMDLRTVTTEYRNGGFVTESRWGGKWRRERSLTDYDANGCRVDTEVTESSDYGAITNRILRYDFLGRAVETVAPDGVTTTAYAGASARPSEHVKVSGGIVRSSVPVYDGMGEEVGTALDGVTNRTDVTYEYDDDWWLWKVTRSTRAAGGAGTETVRETRERLTGLPDGVRSERIDIDENGVASTNAVRLDAASGAVVTTFASPVSSPRVRVAKYGLVLSEQTGEGGTTCAYDAFGRCVRRTRDGRLAEESVYNALGDEVERRTYTNAVGYAAETFAYDSYGRQTSSVDALGNETVTAYDANGLVTARGGAAYPVRYGYDALGNRITMQTTSDGGTWRTTAWTVDPATSRTVAKAYPGGAQVGYTYTADGLTRRETQASGAWREFAYDARRLRTATSFSDPALNAVCASDAFGRLVAETNAVSGVAYARAGDGAATNEAWVVGAHQAVLERERDAFGRIAGRGLANGVWQGVSYTGENRIAAVAAPEATAAYAYAEDGSELGMALAMAGGATVLRQIVRDRYRPELVLAVSNFVGGAAVDVTELGYDALGRVSSRNASNCTYNARSELTGGMGAVYAYDQIGDFAGSAVAYDSDGQVLAEGGLAFAYDAAGRLCAVSSNGVTLASYAYDPQGRRVRKVTPAATHTYFYDGWLLVREVIDRAGGGSETVDYCWGRDLSGSLDGAGGVGGLLYVKTADGIYAPLYDHNGNVTAYVDRSGAVVARYAYDAFGSIRSASGPMADAFRFRFSTKYADPESGLCYYGYRYYSPASRVWLTRDPLGEDAGLNLHAFCGNNPLNGYDALGQSNLSWMELQKKRMEWRLLASMAWPFFPVAADFLMHSIGDAPVDPYVHGNGSRPANAVRSSQRYRDAIMGFVRTVNGRWSSEDYSHVTSVSFPWRTGWKTELDLHLAINSADVQMKGEFCRSGGRIKVVTPLWIKVVDDYDYHQIAELTRERSFYYGTFTGLNDMAYYQSTMGVLTFYTNWIMFSETRIGKGAWK